jgi:hypothetical protein
VDQFEQSRESLVPLQGGLDLGVVDNNLNGGHRKYVSGGMFDRIASLTERCGFF